MAYVTANQPKNNLYVPVITLKPVVFAKPVLSVKFPLQRFILWCTHEEEKHHVGWVGFSITVMTAVFFPLTMSVILLNGAAFGLIIMAMAALTGVVIMNLAALPTKYTIPALFIGIFINLTAICISFI